MPTSYKIPTTTTTTTIVLNQTTRRSTGCLEGTDTRKWHRPGTRLTRAPGRVDDSFASVLRKFHGGRGRRVGFDRRGVQAPKIRVPDHAHRR